MKAAELLVRALEHEGVTHVFAVPGEENLDVIDALRDSTIQLVVTRHEAGAGFMAATMGRLTGKPGVAMSTLGPGATNLMTPTAYAQLGAMPMLALTGQKPIRAGRQGHFQRVDVVTAMAPVTKHSSQIADGASIPASVRDAMRAAAQERPGAVHLELPEDVARQDVETCDLFPTNTIRRPAAEDKAIRQAAGAIHAARSPIVLVGAGANRTATSRMLQRFVDQTSMPFFTTQMGKGVLDERQALCLGTAALSTDSPLHDAIDQADLIINVGHDVVEKPPFFMSHEGGPEVVHVNYSPAQVDPVYFPRYQVIGDVANALWQLGERVQRQPHWDHAPILRMRDALLRNRASGEKVSAVPFHPGRVVHDVRAAVPDDGIVALDNGMYKLWFARDYPAYQPNTLLLDNALASMGAGLPSAIAAAIAHSDRQVVAVCGDGGLMMTVQELETAVRLQLNVTVLVLCDQAYGMIRWKQHRMDMPDFGLTFGNPSFVQLATAFGARGVRVEHADTLQHALTDARAAGGVHVLEVPIDYASYDDFG